MTARAGIPRTSAALPRVPSQHDRARRHPGVAPGGETTERAA